MCYSHPYAALTPPLRRGSALPLSMLLPAILLPSSYPHGRLDDVIDKAYTPGKVVAPKK